MRRAALALLLALASVPALALDWAGKLQQDAEDLRSPNAQLRVSALQRLRRYPVHQTRGYLLRALKDEDTRVQLEAAGQVAEHRLRAAVPVLLGWLAHWENSLRAGAADALGKIGDPSAVKTLVRSLTDPEADVRAKVAAALGQLTTPERREVVALLGRFNPEANSTVRKALVDAVAEKRDKRALIPLLGRLSDASFEVRQSAVLALGKLGDPSAGASLMRLIRDSNSSVAGAAIDVLGKLRYAPAAEALVDVLQSNSNPNRETAAGALGAIANDPAINALMNALSRGHQITAARRALVEAGPKAAGRLVTLLSDSRTPLSVAGTVVEICRDAKLRAAVPALIAQLRLGRLSRSLVARALGQIGDPRAQEPLLEQLDAGGPDLRLAVLESLERIIDERAAEPLLPLLRDPSRRIRILTIDYLGRLRARVATASLLGIAGGRDHELAEAAVQALSQSRDPRAAPQLIALLRSADRGMRRLAGQALARIASPTTVGPLFQLCASSAGDQLVTCVQALGGVARGRSDKAVLALLLRLLQGNDRSAFLASVDALAAMRDPAIVPALVRRYPALDAPLKRRVLDVLGNDPSQAGAALPVLEQALAGSHPTLRAAAAWALGKLQQPSSARALERAARDRSWEVRANAAAGLARLRLPAEALLLRALAGDSSPYVRANAVLALGWARLGDAAPLLSERAIADRSAWVRLNAVRALLQLRPTAVTAPDGRRFPSALKLARAVAAEDPDPRVRTQIDALLAAPVEASRASDWLALYLLNEEQKVLRNERFLLVTSTGLVKVAYSDGMGESWEEGLEEGDCFVELAPPEPAEPAAAERQLR
jgi:cellulose synthase operon protein C